jgi:hypothetical protein
LPRFISISIWPNDRSAAGVGDLVRKKKSSPKPLVFFSHSSRDKRSLQKLVKILRAKTQGAVRFYLTSDDSIIGGADWLKKMTEALADAAVVFAVLSPTSKRSPWVHFEAGFAFASEIPVVPLAVDGVSIDDLQSPFSNWEGRTIRNHTHLWFIFENVNEYCKLSLKRQNVGLCQKDYESLGWKGQTGSNTLVDKYVRYISASEILPQESLKDSREYLSKLPAGRDSGQRILDDINFNWDIRDCDVLEVKVAAEEIAKNGWLADNRFQEIGMSSKRTVEVDFRDEYVFDGPGNCVSKFQYEVKSATGRGGAILTNASSLDRAKIESLLSEWVRTRCLHPRK